jgi:hypothetical protein
MNIINLTPHNVNVITGNGVMITYPKSNTVARVSQTNTLININNGISFFKTVYGDVENLPNSSPDTLYIVSALVKAQANRSDLISPADLVRDADGNIIGCKGFIM